MRGESRAQAVMTTAVALFLMVMCVFLAVAFARTIHEENTCWAAGYEIPINYAGETWCFGQDGEPVAIALPEGE